MIFTLVIDKSGYLVKAFFIQIDFPSFEIQPSPSMPVGIHSIKFDIEPHGSKFFEPSRLQLVLEAVQENREFDIELLEPIPVSKGSIDLEKYIRVKGALVSQSLQDHNTNHLQFQGRVHEISSRKYTARGYYCPFLKVLGNTTFIWHNFVIRVFEDEKEVFTKLVKHIKGVSFCKNCRYPTLLIMSQNPDVKFHGEISIIYKLENGTWNVEVCETSLVLSTFNFIEYSVWTSGSRSFRIAGYQEKSRTLYRADLKIDTQSKYRVFAWANEPQPARYFEDMILVMQSTYVHDMLITMIVVHKSSHIHVLYMDNNRDHIREPDSNVVPKAYDVTDSMFDCHTLSESQEFKVLRCGLATLSVESSVIDIHVSTNIVDPKATYYVGLKKFHNLKGFRPIRAVISEPYFATLVKNIIDETVRHGSSAIDDHQTGKRPDGAQERDFTASSYNCEYLIVIYKIDGDFKDPFAVIESDIFYSNSSELTSSKLQSIYFDLDTVGNATHLIVNARFESQSIIRRFVLQNMTLEVIDAGRVHLRRTKLVLTGLESQQEIPLSDIFKVNIWRLIMIWSLYIMFGVAFYFAGMWIMRNKIFKIKERKSNKTIKIKRIFGSEDSHSLTPERLKASEIGSPTQMNNQTNELTD